MIKILGLFPLTGNGGIASWTKKFLSSFPDEEFLFFPVDVSSKVHKEDKFHRIVAGLQGQKRVMKEVKAAFKNEHFDILHTTTSGNIGSYRDFKVARLCKRFGVKSIMHCRYGCISEDVKSRGFVGYLTRKAMNEFDQIWVLDTRSYNTLKSIPSLSSKVHLTPNSIDVTEIKDTRSKEYNRVAFVGNLIPTKGLYELVEACCNSDVRLDVIGPGTEEIVERVKKIAGDKLNQTIFVHGRLPNNEAVKFIRNVDIIALPTYYPQEAFPISIIEAMSLTKLVISCPRAAIPDMLTDLEGNPCGILVEPQSAQAIERAIKWCQNHKEEADSLCDHAYEKVYACYRKEVVYDMYRHLYKLLLS